jgi:hypothetical protein
VSGSWGLRGVWVAREKGELYIAQDREVDNSLTLCCVQIKELETAWESVPAGQAQPSNTLRSQAKAVCAE